MRGELQEISEVTITHHPASTVAAMLLIGWLASRLQWRTSALAADGDALVGKALAGSRDVRLRLQTAPELLVPGLDGLTIQTTAGRQLRLDRGRGGLQAHHREPDGKERQWTVLGASRGEAGILGEGIRQALLRDSTYTPALGDARALLPS
jgi:hypothetical protein